MTHDELLADINQRYWKMFNHNSQDQTEVGIEHRTLIQNQYFALRAVVELAATYKDENYVNEEFNQGLQTAFQLIIEAIDKELSE